MPKVKQVYVSVPLEALPTVGTCPTMQEVLAALGVNEKGTCSYCINPLGTCQGYTAEAGWQFCPVKALMNTCGIG